MDSDIRLQNGGGRWIAFASLTHIASRCQTRWSDSSVTACRPALPSSPPALKGGSGFDTSTASVCEHRRPQVEKRRTTTNKESTPIVRWGWEVDCLRFAHAHRFALSNQVVRLQRHCVPPGSAVLPPPFKKQKRTPYEVNWWWEVDCLRFAHAHRFALSNQVVRLQRHCVPPGSAVLSPRIKRREWIRHEHSECVRASQTAGREAQDNHQQGIHAHRKMGVGGGLPSLRSRTSLRAVEPGGPTPASLRAARLRRPPPRIKKQKRTPYEVR